MQVASTAGVTSKDSEENICILVGCREVTLLACYLHLIYLVVVLTCVTIVGNLCRQCVVCHALQEVGVCVIARDAVHLLQRVHHLYGCTQLRAACGVTEVQNLVTSPQTCGEADSVADTLQSLQRSVEVLVLLRLLPVDYGLLESLTEIHAVDTVLTVEVCVGCETCGPIG